MKKVYIDRHLIFSTHNKKFNPYLTMFNDSHTEVITPRFAHNRDFPLTASCKWNPDCRSPVKRGKAADAKPLYPTPSPSANELSAVTPFYSTDPSREGRVPAATAMMAVVDGWEKEGRKEEKGVREER